MAEQGICACGCGKRTTPIRKTGMFRKYLRGHYPHAMENSPAWKGGKTEKNGYYYVKMPEHPRADSKGYVAEHILIAEKALGKPLPPLAIVHHHDPIQLVIGQDQDYHMVIHQRKRSFEACGHAHWRKCVICKKHDDPENLYIDRSGSTIYHRDCKRRVQNGREA